MFARIYSLASSLGISGGELLSIARAVAGDAQLRSIEFMFTEHAIALESELESIAWDRAARRFEYPQAA